MLIKCYCHHFVHYFLANKVVERYYIRISKQISVYKKIPLASLLAVAAVCPIVPYYEIFSSSPLQSPFGLLPLNSKRYSNISLSNYMYSVIFFSIQTLVYVVLQYRPTKGHFVYFYIGPFIFQK